MTGVENCVSILYKNYITIFTTAFIKIAKHEKPTKYLSLEEQIFKFWYFIYQNIADQLKRELHVHIMA